MNTFENSKPHKAPSTASHDSATPPKLVEFVLTSWKPKTGSPPKPVKNLAYHKKRREALSQLFPGECLVIPTGTLKVRSNDTYYSFRPNSDFFYLTGCTEPDCVLMLIPRDQGHEEILFVDPNPGKTDTTFFTDRMKGELWAGRRPSIEEYRALYGIDSQPAGTLLAQFKSFTATSSQYRVLSGVYSEFEKEFHPKTDDQKKRDAALGTALSEMRLIKDDFEIRELNTVIKATRIGFEDVIQRLKQAQSERELEGVFYTRARMEGNDVGYASIVASGEHACTLHWSKNDGTLHKRDLLLLDAGIEGRSLYTADITRTLPIGGKFSKEQREIYELVWAAQAAGFKEVRPGNDFMAPNRAAMEVLAHGLKALGILKMPVEEALHPENQFYKRYSLHNVSHMLGLDVHDCAQARSEVYRYGTLKPGMVLTMEPGLYFQMDDLTVPAKYRGIGVRIEDDVLVTDKGCKNLSSFIPSRADEVESWMKTIWKKRK